LDCRPKKCKTDEIQTKIREIQTIKTDFMFGFPGFLKESGKSKLKNSEIQTIMRGNPNQKAVFLFFGFRRFYVWVSRILVWISLIM
jgi:hypothetical protein